MVVDRTHVFVAAFAISALTPARAFAESPPATAPSTSSSAASPPAPAPADDGKAAETRPGLLDRSHTVAEFEAGLLALPTAPISRAHQGGSTVLGPIGKGDATMMTGLHLLYRGAPEWAIGAGFMFAPRPTSDDLTEEDSATKSTIPRTHTRSYLLVGAEGRYFPFRRNIAEVWVGLAGSAVVIADRYGWQSAPAVPTILGSRTMTISTEGFAIAVQAGGNWMFADRWVAGLTARASRWILPQTPTCSPVGDCATLSGTVEAFELGLTLGYRIPL